MLRAAPPFIDRTWVDGWHELDTASSGVRLLQARHSLGLENSMVELEHARIFPASDACWQFLSVFRDRSTVVQCMGLC
eukprot:768575-Hanusia_phi.AAC.6